MGKGSLTNIIRFLLNLWDNDYEKEEKIYF